MLGEKSEQHIGMNRIAKCAVGTERDLPRLNGAGGAGFKQHDDRWRWCERRIGERQQHIVRVAVGQSVTRHDHSGPECF